METAISLTDVTKDYPGVKALDAVTFSVEKGQVHGFLGPNGAGKSTAMKIMAGIIPATSGQIKILGNDLAADKNKVQSQIGILPDTPPLYDHMTVESYLRFVASIQREGEMERKVAVEHIISKCGLTEVRKRFVGHLSKGYRQRVGIAQALVHDPEIVILDEPTSGLDPAAIVEIRNLILSLRGDHTILISSHLLHEIQLVCSHITIINEGKIIKTGSIEELRNSFQTRQVISARVKKWEEHLTDSFSEKFHLDELLVGTDEECTELTFYSRKTDDIRSLLGEEIVAAGLGLLSLNEKELALEDMFRLATEEGQ